MTSDSRPTALITGCSEPRGLGANIAMQLVKKGYRVFASARKVSAMDFLDGVCELVELDVTNAKSREAAVERISHATGGELSLLVNNAGVLGVAPALDTDLEGFRKLLEVNLVAPLAIAQAFTPLLVAANQTSGRQSVLLNIGSFTMHGAGWCSAYVASKAGLEAMSDVMRIEMANLGVRVVNCETGALATEMSSGGKPFEIKASNPSPFYPNFAAMEDKMMKAAATQSPTTGETVAYRLVKAIDRRSPPRKVWIGTASSMVAFVASFQLFWMLWLKDLMFAKLSYTGLVRRPGLAKKMN